jgi:hypothetical protein
LFQAPVYLKQIRLKEEKFKMRIKLLAVLVVLFLAAGLAFGQREMGTINGTITDPTGAVVPDATITVTSVATGAARTTSTGSSGYYSMASLKADIYDVTIEGKGFQKVTRRVELTVGGVSEVSAKLAVAGTTTAVEVVAEGGAAQVNTETQTLSDTVGAQQLSQLPVFDRDPYGLVATAGNIAPDTSARGLGYAINGQRSSSTDILLDGGENVDMFTTGEGQAVPLDSVQEFSVVTSNFTAEYGRASGGVVNVATKSGTNNLHGSVYEYNRVGALTANTVQNLADRTQAFSNGTCTAGSACQVGKFNYTRNQFGGTIGGPIIKNKLFFFASNEETLVRSNTTVDADIMDPAFLTNLSTAGFCATCGTTNPTVQFMNAYGTIRSSGVGVLEHVNYGAGTGQGSSSCTDGLGNPFPCSSPFMQKVQYSSPGDSGGGLPQNTYDTVGKIDYNITDRTSFSARYAFYQDKYFAGTINNSPYAGYDTEEDDRNQNLGLTLTHIFSPTLVSTTKFFYNRLKLLQPLSSSPNATCAAQPEGACPTLYASWEGLFSMADTNAAPVFPGYSEFTPGSAIPFGGPQNVYQYMEDLAWTKGKHQFKIGGANNLGLPNLVNGDLAYFNVAINPMGAYPCPHYADGSYAETPSCQVATPLSLPSFARSNMYNDGSFYAQDAWKVLPRLTLNLGVRWEFYGTQHNGANNCVTEANGAHVCGSELDSNFNFGTGPDIWDQIRNGGVTAGQSLWNSSPNNWAPRVGFAWDVFGDGKTSLRGGYGMAYERNFGNVTFNVIQNAPNYAPVQFNSGSATPLILNGATVPIPINNFGPMSATGVDICNPGVVSTVTCVPPSTLRAVDKNIHTAYSEFYSLAIDHQILKNTVASLQYSGSRGVHLYDIANINQSGMGGNPFDYFGTGVATNLYPQFTCLYGPFFGSVACNSQSQGQAGFLGTNTSLPGGGCWNDTLNCQYGNINYRGSGGQSWYNAMNVKVSTTNLYNTGLTLTANYTFQHSMDDLSNTFSEGESSGYQLGYTNPFNPMFDKGNSEFDVRHRVVLSGTWDIPFAKNMHGAARQILHGWSISPILTVQSGNPYTMYDCFSWGYGCSRWNPGQAVRVGAGDMSGVYQATTSTGAIVPNVFNWLPIPQTTSNTTCAYLFGLSSCAIGEGSSLIIPACTGLYGVGCYYGQDPVTGAQVSTPFERNQFQGPDNWDMDMSFAKKFKLTERFGLTFRSDLFNFFNHSNWGIDSGTFDVLTNAFNNNQNIQVSRLGDRRYVTFTLKLDF